MRNSKGPVKATAVRWIVLGLVCSIYFVTYVDRVNISIAAPTISTELSLAPAVMGLVFSAFSIPYTLLQIPGGWLADRFGPRRALSGMGLLWAFSTALTAIPTSALGLAVARLGVGSAEGGAFPTATRAFTAWIPSARRGLAQGLPHSFARLGGAAAPPVVVALMLAYGWRAAFVALGAVSLLLIFVWGWFYRDRPRDHWLTNLAEIELLDREAGTPGTEARAKATPWRALVRRMWPVTLADFCYGWSLWVFLTWLPSYLSRHETLAWSNWRCSPACRSSAEYLVMRSAEC
jgi:MFS family permease